MSKQVAEIQEQINWHWRNSMRPIRFFKFDVKAAIPFCLLLVYLRVSTVIFAIAVMLFFWILEKNGLTFDAAMRSSRVLLFGKERPALMAFRYRKLRDYG